MSFKISFLSGCFQVIDHFFVLGTFGTINFKWRFSLTDNAHQWLMERQRFFFLKWNVMKSFVRTYRTYLEERCQITFVVVEYHAEDIGPEIIMITGLSISPG